MQGKGGKVDRVIVVAADPGDDTGWAWFECKAEELLEGGIQGGVAQRSSCTWDAGSWEWRREGLGMNRVRWENHQANLFLGLCREVWSEADVDPEKDVFVAVVETFTLRILQMDESLLAPVRVSSKIDLLMEPSGLRRAGFSPADAKTVVTNERLRRWGLIPADQGGESGKVRHAIDAERQAVLFLKKWYSDVRFRSMYPPGLRQVPQLAEMS